MFQTDAKTYRTNLSGQIIGTMSKVNGDQFIAWAKAAGDSGAPYGTHAVAPHDCSLHHGHYCETREQALADLAVRAGVTTEHMDSV